MLMHVLGQILHGTPAWVFLLFVGLTILGYLQSKPRELTPARLAILPAALGLFSLSRVVGSFGLEPLVLAAWAGGSAAALMLNRVWKQPAGARWSAATGRFHVPGSWVPLGLMMAMFFSRYALAVSQSMAPALVHAAGFRTGASLGLGLLSGMFLARAMWIWAQRAAEPVFNHA